MGIKKFKIDARTLLTLGRDSIKDHTTAVVELVKNSYDADARVVEINLFPNEKPSGRIRIADSGDGMSESEVENNWLRVGFSGKREFTTTKVLKRRKTGEKGIGRLSADRLGAILELRTKAARKLPVGLKVDWSRFEKMGVDIENIHIPTLDDKTPSLPDKSTTGTELLITKLRQQWTEEDVEKLHAELGLLLPPFAEIANDFEIRFKNDVLPHLDGKITTEIAAQAEIELDAELAPTGLLTFTLTYNDRKTGTRKTKTGKTLWVQMAPSIRKSKGNLDETKQECLLGPMAVKLSFFVRRAELLEGTGFSLGQLREFLDRNSGIRIYRDLIRVKPYGDPDSPEGDWLSLNERKSSNPAGAGRESFRISGSQVVGAVFITRDRNPQLVDSSSREGLIEGDAFRQLRNVVMECITQIENRYHAMHVEENGDPVTKASIAKAAVQELKTELSTLKSELTGLKSSSSPSQAMLSRKPAMEQIDLVLNRLAGAEKQIEEIASQNTVYRGLATVGIASAVFGHETQISTDLAQGSLALAKLSLQEEDVDVGAALGHVNEAEEYVRQIASWGKFALLRVKKDKRQKQKVSIEKIINGVLTELERPLSESKITLNKNLAEITARTFPMDVEAVVINFVTNAYHAVKMMPKKRTIQVDLGNATRNNRNGFQIVVSDSGPGFAKDDAEMLWQPLFSTRVDSRGRAIGTGLGLTIVKSAVQELGGTVEAERRCALGGARFTAWFPQG